MDRAFCASRRFSLILVLAAGMSGANPRSLPSQGSKTQNSPVPVRYTDVREAAGDFDNDGYPDLYVTGYGRAILYHNNGEGRFTDVTVKAGVADEGVWSTSAGWFDYDKDGWLDLVVTNYIEWTPKNNLWCGEHRPGYRSYCHPGNYKGQKTKLYHNNHDGTFTDVSDASGVGKPESKGMGVVMEDFNNDGWPDIDIANDTASNFIFLI